MATSDIDAVGETFAVDGLLYTVTAENEVSVGAESTEISGEIIIPATVEHSGVTYDVTSMETYGFSGCSLITSVIIQAEIPYISSYAFQNATSLVSIAAPNLTSGVAMRAFERCTSLTDVSLPDGIKSIANGSFYGCTALTEMVIPNGVTIIGNSAFSGCVGLASVTIPDTVTTLERYAFYRCTALTEIAIPDSVTLIDGYAFYNCQGLVSVSIGSSIATLGENVFVNCPALTSMEILSASAPALSGVLLTTGGTVIVKSAWNPVTALEGACDETTTVAWAVDITSDDTVFGVSGRSVEYTAATNTDATFSITGGTADWISVDPDTGVLSGTAPTVENLTTYTCEITATSTELSTNADTVILTVTVYPGLGFTSVPESDGIYAYV